MVLSVVVAVDDMLFDIDASAVVEPHNVPTIITMTCASITVNLMALHDAYLGYAELGHIVFSILHQVLQLL